MLHTHCVSLALYERKCADYDALLDKYHALKLQGAVQPSEPKPGRVVPPGPSPEALAAQRMHDEIVTSMAKDIEALPGVDPAVARAEAQRLRDEVLGKGTVL